MEPLIKRSWLIDSVIIIALAFLLTYMHTYHVEYILFKIPFVTFLVFYFFGKGVQMYNDKKDLKEKDSLIKELKEELKATEKDVISDVEDTESDTQKPADDKK